MPVMGVINIPSQALLDIDTIYKEKWVGGGKKKI